MKLHEKGKVTNRKGIYDGFSACTFAAGTRELYDWLDGREEVRFLPVERINDPSIIARNRNMISINGALSVDLAGQIAADTVGGRQYSGIGGHEDFVNGASFSEGGRSLVCLPSTARVRFDGGERSVSRLVAGFPPGTLDHHAAPPGGRRRHRVGRGGARRPDGRGAGRGARRGGAPRLPGRAPRPGRKAPLGE